MTKEVLKENYENACNDYIEVFCKKQSVEFSFWVGDEIGGTACFNNYYCIGLTDIVYDINTNQKKDLIFEWWDSGDRVNYDAYTRGEKGGEPEFDFFSV